MFLRHTDAGGNKVEVTAVAANGFNFKEVQRTYTAAGVTTVESYLYAYQNESSPDATLESVALRRKVGLVRGHTPSMRPLEVARRIPRAGDATRPSRRFGRFGTWRRAQHPA